MIKDGHVEKKLTRIEEAVEQAWILRKASNSGGPPREPVDLYDSGAGDSMSFLRREFEMPSPVLGNEIVCARLDKDDLGELHRRFYAMMKKIRRFEFFFFHYCVWQVCTSAEQTYQWFISWAQLLEVPVDIQTA